MPVTKRYDSAFTTPYLVAQQDGSAVTLPTAGNEQQEYDENYNLALRYCFDYSKVVEATITERTFIPYQDTRTYRFNEIIDDKWFYSKAGDYVLRLHEDLFGIDSVTVMGTVLTVDDDFRVSDNAFPYRQIVFNPAAFPSWDRAWGSAIVVVGQWGVHDNPNTMYTNATTLNGALDDSTVSVVVADATGLQVYQYIKIDSELMLITAISNSTLTVRRGVNGFAAAAHLDTTAVQTYNVVGDVQELTTRMVAYHLRNKNDVGDSVTLLSNAVIIRQFDKHITEIAERRRYYESGVV